MSVPDFRLDGTKATARRARASMAALEVDSMMTPVEIKKEPKHQGHFSAPLLPANFALRSLAAIADS